MGSSGSGKSTIMSLILRYYDPTDGQICIDNISLSELNVHWLRNQIGLVSQEPILFGVSIADNIKYGREDVNYLEIVEAAKQANAHDFIMKLPKVPVQIFYACIDFRKFQTNELKNLFIGLQHFSW